MKKWSILIYILIITLISSLLLLLWILYLNNTIEIWRIIYYFTKTYYYALEWINLQFTKIKHHPYWFEENLSWKNYHVINKSNSNIIADDINIFNINNCEYINFFQLKTGEWILIPLFKAKYINKYTIKSDEIIELKPIEVKVNSNSSYIIWSIWDENEIFTWNWKQEFNFIKWEFIWIISLDNNNLCIKLNKKLPSNINYIESKGYFLYYNIYLKWIKKNKLPDELLYTIY